MKKVLAGKLLPIVLLVLLIIGGCKKENPTKAPELTTSAVKGIGTTSAICGGQITSVGGEAITELGVCISTSENPTTTDLKVKESPDSRTFSITVTNLSKETTYHVRAFATNSVGTGYGEDISFTTSSSPVPTITTTAITNLSFTTAASGGTIVIYGGAIISEKGVCWSTAANPTTADSKTTQGAGGDSFISSISGLTIGTIYHIRAYAVYAAGTTYGEDLTFTTLTPVYGAPTLTTTSISSITTTTAVSGGVIVFDGGQSITAKGVCWSTTANPTIANSKTSDGAGSANFTSSITGLLSSTYYHVRAYATNSVGTAYGNDVFFKTLVVTSTAAEEFLLGNPSNATTNAGNSDYLTNYLLSKPQYCSSFNNTTHNTNWTSWHLFAGDLGGAARSSSFSSDPDLPAAFYHVQNFDYSYSTYGMERGHMCPSADRTASDADNLSTFVMSNAIPQSPNCNGIVWGALEDYGRTLVGQGNELYIICGPYGTGGTAYPNGQSSNGVLASNFVNGVGGVNINVPAEVWKIIVVIPNGNDDINRITAATRVIAVKMPNTIDSNLHNWKYYRTSVDAIELLTGYDFLSNVPVGVQAIIEANADTQ